MVRVFSLRFNIFSKMTPPSNDRRNSTFIVNFSGKSPWCPFWELINTGYNTQHSGRLTRQDVLRGLAHRSSDGFLRGANLSNLKLRNVDLSGLNMQGCNLSGVDLSGSDLSSTNLQCSNLTDAKFNCSRMQKAQLTGSNLRRCDFQNAEMTDTNFVCANLREANLISCNLKNSNFMGANLEVIALHKSQVNLLSLQFGI